MLRHSERALICWGSAYMLLAGYGVVVSGPALAGELQPASAASDRTRPNFVLIFTDDQAPGTLGFAGNPNIRTPRLDELARQGAYFSRAYVPSPRCSPSRASLLTGLYPHQHGVMTNTDARLKPDAIIFSELLRGSGYACGLIGKWHLGNEREPQASFNDLWVTFPLGDDYSDPTLYVNGQSVQREGFLTDILTDYAIQFVEQHKGGPFLLWLAYKAPHRPFELPPDSRDRYNATDLPLPKSLQDDLSTKPKPQRYGRAHQLFQVRSLPQIREDLSTYYSMISCIDRNVGRLVDRLQALGLDKKTLVMYMSDNGLLFGEHQMLRKGAVFYEELVRTPLILWWPGRIQPGTRIEALASSLDIFPTLCGLAHVPTPAGLPGHDLFPLIEGKQATIHDALMLEFVYWLRKEEAHKPLRGLVTTRYKYVSYEGDGEELYDLQADPHEMRNLIGHPTHERTRSALRRRLDEWRTETGDQP